MAIETAEDAEKEEIAKKQIERDILEQAEKLPGFLDRFGEVHMMLSAMHAFVIWFTGHVDIRSILVYQGVIFIVSALGGILTNVKPPEIKELAEAKEIYKKKAAEAGVKK